jgi:hypothetical protein
MQGFMKYAVEMGSGAMIYIPVFIKTVSEIQKVYGGGGLRRHRVCRWHKHTFIFQNEGSSLIR